MLCSHVNQLEVPGHYIREYSRVTSLIQALLSDHGRKRSVHKAFRITRSRMDRRVRTLIKCSVDLFHILQYPSKKRKRCCLTLIADNGKPTGCGLIGTKDVMCDQMRQISESSVQCSDDVGIPVRSQ